jgi:hypothetical protein
MIPAGGKSKFSDKEKKSFRSAHHKSHTDYTETEPGAFDYSNINTNHNNNKNKKLCEEVIAYFPS